MCRTGVCIESYLRIFLGLPLAQGKHSVPLDYYELVCQAFSQRQKVLKREEQKKSDPQPETSIQRRGETVRADRLDGCILR